MDLSTKAAVHFNIAELAELMNRAFTGYVGGSANFSATSFADFLYHSGVDLNLSQVVLRREQPVGFGLIARQGWTSRLAAMGIVPDMTGQGIGKWLLGQLLDEARARADHSFVLEVIEQNPRGVKLYTGAGFRMVQKLFGYTAPPSQMETNAILAETDIFEVAKLLLACESEDLPWQLSGTTLVRLGPPNRGYRLGPACAVISDSAPQVVVIRSVIVPTAHQRQGYGTAILQALMAHHPHRSWKIPAICPESIGAGFFEKIGFVRDELSQLQMELDL